MNVRYRCLRYPDSTSHRLVPTERLQASGGFHTHPVRLLSWEKRNEDVEGELTVQNGNFAVVWTPKNNPIRRIDGRLIHESLDKISHLLPLVARSS